MAATFAARLSAQEQPATDHRPLQPAACRFVPAGPAAETCTPPEELEHLRVGTGYTVGPGELEMDLIASHLRTADGRLDALRAEIAYGVTRWLQVELGYLAHRAGSNGGANARDRVEVEGKWGIVRAPHIAVAASAALELSPANDADSAPRWGTELVGAVSRPWRAVQARLHGEVGVEIEGAAEVEAWLFNAAGERVIGAGWLVELAWNGRVARGRASGAVVPALEWHRRADRSDGIGAAVGVPIGVTNQGERWGVILHVEIEF